jgi:regulator of sigma D
MFNFFRKKVAAPSLKTSAVAKPKPAQPVAQPQAQATDPVRKQTTGLQHDAGLVVTLMQEHQHLLKLFTEIAELVTQKKWHLVEGKLKSFKEHLVDHLIKEGIKLYAYGSVACKNDPSLLSTFNSFKVEMSNIGSVVFNFIEKWHKPDALKDVLEQNRFELELKGIGEALVARIEREEKTLYPLYDSLRDLAQNA